MYAENMQWFHWKVASWEWDNINFSLWDVTYIHSMSFTQYQRHF